MANAFKFFNIGKANEEISRLETALAALQAERDAAQGNLTQLEQQAQADRTALASAQTSLSSALASVETLNTHLTAKNAELSSATEKHKTDLAALEASVETRASAKAATIVEGLGLKVPITLPKPGSPGASGSLDEVRAEMAAEKDPFKRAQLARKCRDLRGHKDLFKTA